MIVWGGPSMANYYSEFPKLHQQHFRQALGNFDPPPSETERANEKARSTQPFAQWKWSALYGVV